MIDSTKYTVLTPAMALGLAAPHTWVASITPVLIACAGAYSTTGCLSVGLSLVLLLICILLQSAVNTLNDYFDYVKGSDTPSDNLEKSDAVLLYNNVNPKSALCFAISLIIVAFLLGIYPIIVAGWVPLLIAVLGAAIVFLYSGGKTPVSYLPIGELVSGCTMGGFMGFACYFTLTQSLDWVFIVWSIPQIIGIALIMQTNNTCDIEKDVVAGRKTLPVLIGRHNSVVLYKVLVILWLVIIALNTVVWFSGATIILPFMLLASIPICKGLFVNPLTNASRIAAMSNICTANVAFSAFYAAIIFAGHITLVL